MCYLSVKCSQVVPAHQEPSSGTQRRSLLCLYAKHPETAGSQPLFSKEEKQLVWLCLTVKLQLINVLIDSSARIKNHKSCGHAL